MTQINGYDAITTPADTDEHIIQQTGGGLNKKITQLNMLKVIQAEVDALEANPSLPANYIEGLEISNDTDTDHDINIETGRCKDSTGAVDRDRAVRGGSCRTTGPAEGDGSQGYR